MNATAPAGAPRRRILCLLSDGATPATLRWAEALARAHEVDIVDLSLPGLSYDALLARIFAAERVISW